MQAKKDYYQMKNDDIMVISNKPDKHVEVWWRALGEDGKIYPVELQMSSKGTQNLINKLRKALHEINRKW